MTKRKLRKRIAELEEQIKSMETYRVSREDFDYLKRTVEKYKEVLDGVGKDNLSARNAIANYLCSEYALDEGGKMSGTISASETTELVKAMENLTKYDCKEIYPWWRQR